jgi:hypothetical protein
MNRQWIVCATCRGAWPMSGAASPYFEMELMSQLCPRCEAYTHSCVSGGDVNFLDRQGVEVHPSEPDALLADVWQATQR